MNNLRVSNDIIPIGEFKISLSKWFKNVQNTGHPLIVITFRCVVGPEEEV
jgi:antitoxin YefM